MSLLQNGQVIDGFEVRRPLGEGGFAEVFDAIELASGQRVALKVLRPDSTGEYDDGVRRRFDRETRIVAGLKGPHIVRLFGSGQFANGLLFAAFEYVPGEDLADYLRRGRPSVKFVRRILRELLEALREAHAAGLIHRDIKPQNIRVFEPSPGAAVRVKLLDFGIARATDGGHPSLTKTGELIGTPRYMSPEQLTSAPLTPASDIYSLGMVIFEALAGEGALPGGRLGEQLTRMDSGHVFSAPELERVGPELVAIVQRMTARRAEDRYGSAAAVLAALDGRARRPVAGSTARPQTLVVALTVVALLVVVVAGAVSSSEDEPPPLVVNKRLGALVKTSRPDAALTAPAPPAAPRRDVGPPVEEAVPTPPWWTDFESGCGHQPRTAVEMQKRIGSRFILPPSYDPGEPLPLVIALHADFDTTASIAFDGKLGRLARKERFMIVAPYDDVVDRLEGLRSPLAVTHHWVGAQHGADLGRLVRVIYEAACLDPRRVYVFGQESGGLGAMAAACEPWLAGAAIFGLGMPERVAPQHWCEQQRPVIWFHPTDSQAARSEPGRSCRGFDQAGIAVTEQRWRERNACGEASSVTTKRKSGVCHTFACEVPFELCRVEGGIALPGQPPWPSAAKNPFAGKDCAPEVAGKFPTLKTAWRFLSANSLPDE